MNGHASGAIATSVHARGSCSPWLAEVCGLLLLAGCAGGVSRQDAASFDTTLGQGNYADAAKVALASGQIGADGSSKNLAWSLNGGAALVYSGEQPHAVLVFDGAEDLMKSQNLSTFGDSQYQYATYDGIMVNVYKGLAFLGAGDKSNARVEFNRVGERESLAEEQFAQQKAKLDADAQKQATGSFDLNAAMQNARNDKGYQAEQSELGQYANYRRFINPAASYLRALYLLNNATGASDFEQARVELARVRDMAGPNPAVQADLALATHPTGKIPPTTWIVFENGQAPTFTEYRMTFPVPVIGKGGHAGVGMVTVAMPRMVFHAPAAGGLSVTSDSTQIPTASIGDFDHVMATEFKDRQSAIMTHVVVEAALKTALQTAAAQTGNAVLQMGARVASNIATCDTRSWTALPKGFQAARVAAPKDGHLHLRTDTGVDFGDVLVPSDHAAIVYVKQLVPGGKPSIQVFQL